MAYQVLARKWRPQDFSSLIGQKPIITALRNALSEERIAQAYLFSGIRGVGKTTAARLLAKSLNCVHGPTPEPCNECTPCREITAGADLDVIEVDAATYSKVEQVRELTESLRYGAARDRYKVVVVDEIHRLSRQAFDALLKIVEEPPPHLVFVFATTEAEAVPATILSRCQEFHFRRVSSPVVAQHLRGIAEAEEIEVSDPALRLIARAGEGSVRDSVALLDQLATFGAGEIADEDAARLVGGVDAGLLLRLLSAVLGGDGLAVGETVRHLETEGWDPRNAYSQFLTFTRDALHLALAGRGGGDPEVSLPEEDAAALAELAAEAGYENLLRLLQQLLAAETMVRRTENGYLALEIAWLRAAELPKLVRVEQILGGDVTSPAPRPAARQRAAKSAAPAAEPTPKTRPKPTPPQPHREAVRQTEAPEAEPAARQSERPPEPAPEAPSERPRSLDGFLEYLRLKKPPLAARLEAAELSFEDGVLSIHHDPADHRFPRSMGRDSNRELMDEAVAATWGDDASWRLEEGEATTAAEPDSDDEPPAIDPEAAEHPTVQTVLELFGGEIDGVETRHDQEQDEEPAGPDQDRS